MYRRRFKRQIEEFPQTLEEFGYMLNEAGEIRSLQTNEPYQFEVKPKDHNYNKKRYDAFITIIGDKVEEKLQRDPCNLVKQIVPVNANPDNGDIHSYFYMTPNALTTPDRLLLLIPGNDTRIGQWSKRVMCDENINTGSMIHTTALAKERGYEVIILNPNANFWYDGKPSEMPPPNNERCEDIPENENPEAHTLYVFRHFIQRAKAKDISVIAMGWGGYSFTLAINDNFDFIKSRVRGVALSNSSHTRDIIDGDDKRVWIRNHMVNLDASNQPKGQVLADTRFGCECLSSAQEISDFIITSCEKEIWRFLDLKMGDIEEIVVDTDFDPQAPLDEAEEAELAEHLNVVSVG